MKIILFSNGKNEITAKRLQKAVESAVSVRHLEIIRGVKELCTRLCRFSYEIDVAVVLADSKDQLSELVSMADILTDVRIIIVLPDKEKETISKGHSLRPRFLTFADSDFNDVAAVLKKMIGTLNTRNPDVVNQKSIRR